MLTMWTSVLRRYNMLYKMGMLCKHFKGENLLEKNIYRIERLGVNGYELIDSDISYVGEGNLSTARDLVVYANIFQDNKMFAREYEDISSELSADKQTVFHQVHKVEPLTSDEIEIINSEQFKSEKKAATLTKFKK